MAENSENGGKEKSFFYYLNPKNKLTNHCNILWLVNDFDLPQIQLRVLLQLMIFKQISIYLS